MSFLKCLFLFGWVYVEDYIASCNFRTRKLELHEGLVLVYLILSKTLIFHVLKLKNVFYLSSIGFHCFVLNYYSSDNDVDVFDYGKFEFGNWKAIFWGIVW